MKMATISDDRGVGPMTKKDQHPTTDVSYARTPIKKREFCRHLRFLLDEYEDPMDRMQVWSGRSETRTTTISYRYLVPPTDHHLFPFLLETIDDDGSVNE